MSTNYRRKYEQERARANRNASYFHELSRKVDHACKVAGALHHAMERDSMGIGLPPYLALAILANKQAADAARMESVRASVQ